MTDTLEHLKSLLEQTPKDNEGPLVELASQELIVAAVNALPKLIACAEALQWYAIRDWPLLLRDDIDRAMREDGHDMGKRARAALAALSKVQP